MLTSYRRDQPALELMEDLSWLFGQTTVQAMYRPLLWMGLVLLALLGLIALLALAAYIRHEDHSDL